MVFRHSYMLPPLLGILMGITVTVTYVWSTSNKHVKRVFPYISDTGTWPPESCLFSILIFSIAVLVVLITYIRYRQVRLTYELSDKQDSTVKKLNVLAHWSGYIAGFGMAIVASFQETNALYPHIVGAFFAFGIGCFYQTIQTFISWKIYPQIGLKQTNYIRIILTIISTITYWVCQIFGLMAMINFKGENLTLWDKNDGGYTYHLVSTITEWILTASTVTYFVLYTGEFKDITIYEPQILEI